MDPNGVKEYISAIQRFNNPEIDSVSLNILEQYAWEKSLSAYQIFTKLRSTDSEMAYKNVNKRVRGLVSLNLIQETKDHGNYTNKHGAKYYSLTEFGIYQLFLNRLNGLYIRQQDTVKFNRPPSLNILIFFRNYHNSLLFRWFLYPYFEQDTLFAIGNYLLWDLYDYLAECCHRIRQQLKYHNYGIKTFETIFHWNKVRAHNKNQTNYKDLLLHLKEQFNLESIDPCEIENNGDNNDTITVKTPTASIMLRYYRDKEKVIAMSTAGGEYKSVEYSTVKLGSDIQIVIKQPDEEFFEDIILEAKKQMLQIIYEFVCDLSLSSSNPENSQEFSYYRKILSQDKKFMAAVEEIYKNKHREFEKGYQMLTANAS